MHKTFEIEIKSLLGGKERAESLVRAMKKDSSFKATGIHRQLNHYFAGNDLRLLAKNLAKHFSPAQRERLEELASDVKDFSVRTRKADERIIFVLKVTVDDTTSENGTARLEFEVEIKNMSLPDLDKIMLDSGFDYQAKWSREREEYKYKGLNVMIDKNAGYGYVIEFEKNIEDESKAEETKKEIRAVMKILGAEELPQDRLARMFDHYNKNWRDYYGTEKTFIIE